MDQVMYTQAQQQKYRVTLEFDVYEDFDPYNIEWKKLFEIENDESLGIHIEDLSEVVNY
jgi:hypothetical protein